VLELCWVLSLIGRQNELVWFERPFEGLVNLKRNRFTSSREQTFAYRFWYVRGELLRRTLFDREWARKVAQ
jgi:hypothetical protein